MVNLIPEEDGLFLLQFARTVLEAAVKDAKVVKSEKYPESLDKKFGVFCTIFKNQKMRGRGCAGVPAFAGLMDNTLEAVKASAKEDPRFEPIAEEELKDVKLEMSVLSEPKIIEVSDPQRHIEAVNVGDGLLLKYGPYESLFPPQVWKTIKNKEAFLDTLCLSAGMTEGMWKEPGAKLYRFSAQVFTE